MSNIIGQILFNRYRVESFIGRGGMAEVYKVWDIHRSAWLAMKVLHENLALDNVFLRRFQREAKTLARLSHPNIVRFYGLEQEGRFICILMDYVEGESLKPKIFDAQGAMPFEQVYAIMRELSWALKYAHSEGFIHADIKPDNIMIDKNGRVMLSDFGIARMSEVATATMIGAGTPAYMAPEQIIGESPSIETDIYSLGIVLYEMLTGERPFTGELATGSGTTRSKIGWEHINLNPTLPSRWNPTIPFQLDALILKTLAKEKEARFENIGELLQELSKVFQHILATSPLEIENSQNNVKQVLSAKKENLHLAQAKIWFKEHKKLGLVISAFIVLFLFLGYIIKKPPSSANSIPTIYPFTAIADVLETDTPPAPPLVTTPTNSADLEESCTTSYETRLEEGDIAYVSITPSFPNRVRERPSIDSTFLGQIYSGEKIEILKGPVCSDNMLWWKIESLQNNIRGWTSEGDSYDYWLVPLD